MSSNPSVRVRGEHVAGNPAGITIDQQIVTAVEEGEIRRAGSLYASLPSS